MSTSTKLQVGDSLKHRPPSADLTESFVAEPDIKRMLKRVRAKGHIKSAIINKALRPMLKSMGYGRKNDPTPKSE